MCQFLLIGKDADFDSNSDSDSDSNSDSDVDADFVIGVFVENYALEALGKRRSARQSLVEKD